MNKEIMTRFNPKVQSFTEGGGGFGMMSPADYAACMVGAPNVGVSTLFASVAGCRTKIPVMHFYSMVTALSGMENKQHWNIRKTKTKEPLRALLQIALFEHCYGGACPTCKGTTFMISKPTEGCRRCKGTGKYLFKLEEKAKYFKVAKSTWLRDIEYPYSEIMRYIQDQEHEVLRIINKNLKEGIIQELKKSA